MSDMLSVKLYTTVPGSTDTVWKLLLVVDKLVDYSTEIAEGFEIAPLAGVVYLISLVIDVDRPLEFGAESAERITHIRIF